MTMAVSAPLQTALYTQLTGAPALAGLSGRIFDDAPHQSADIKEAYVTLGDERVAAWNTATEVGAVHEVVIRVYSPVRGFLTAKQIAAEVAHGLAHLHSLGLLHRDVKPANIVFVDGRAKLADLGLTRFLRIGTAMSAGLRPAMATW